MNALTHKLRLHLARQKVHLILHATHSGTFDVYLIKDGVANANTSPLVSFVNTASLQTWLSEESNLTLLHKATWRILADARDPISTCITLPNLGRRDELSFVQQRLNTHQPDAPWRYAEATSHGTPENNKSISAPTVMLMALPETHSVDQRLHPAMDTMHSLGHRIEALYTSGQLLARQYGEQSNPGELLVCACSEGNLAVLCVFGQYRFSRHLPRTIEAASVLKHVLPTLITHQLISRNQPVEVRYISDCQHPLIQANQLAEIELSNMSNKFRGSHIDQTRWLNRTRLQAFFAIFFAACISITLPNLSHGWIVGNEFQEKSASPPTQEDLLQHAILIYKQDDTCPSLVRSLERLSQQLNPHTGITLEKLRWECLQAHQGAQISLNVLLSDSSPTQTALKELLNDLSSLGITDAKPNLDSLHFIVQIKLPARESSIEQTQYGSENSEDPWPERGIFTEATTEGLQHWLHQWSSAYVRLHSGIVSASIELGFGTDRSEQASTPTSDSSASLASQQGTLTVSLTSVSEPHALIALDTLSQSFPALVRPIACDWTPIKESTKTTLKTQCKLGWKRFPMVTKTQRQLPLDNVNYFAILPALGKLFWTMEERSVLDQSSQKVTSNRKRHNIEFAPNDRESHGWIKRSDGITLRWPAT
jgi:hypothetical protein